jgi:hypothetical protein
MPLFGFGSVWPRLLDLRWLDTSHSGETREVAGIKNEQVPQAVCFHQGDQPSVMGLLAQDTVLIHKGAPACANVRRLWQPDQPLLGSSQAGFGVI